MALPKLEVPTYELTLPSNGKKIRYRPFLVKEHKILLTMVEASQDEVVRIITELVDVCTFNELKMSNIAHFDIEYIFMMLRAKSVSEKVDVVITCVECEEKYDASFNIEDIKVEKKEGHTNKIQLNQTVGVEMKYPKFKDIVNVFDSDESEDVFKLVKNSIIGVFEGDSYYEFEEHTEEEKEDFLYSLTKEQFSKIEEFFVSSPKVVQQLETDCPKCSHHNTSRIEGLQNFFV
jgi:hypothetical protein